jgi:UDP-N-acetylglucosamine--N-acetylmuramyl-(pentapeptide) pyrophosphoryl-undecaprenol N-acetylglucosamine transferase
MFAVRDRLSDWQIVHQCGPGNVPTTQRQYGQLGIEAQVEPLFENVAEELVTADLVISRAGGGTLAELALAGAPAILVPFGKATDGHQRANAHWFESVGACVVVPEAEPRAAAGRKGESHLQDRLAQSLKLLLDDPLTRWQLGDKIRRLARPDAASVVARHVIAQLGSARNWRDLARGA